MRTLLLGHLMFDVRRQLNFLKIGMQMPCQHLRSLLCATCAAVQQRRACMLSLLLCLWRHLHKQLQGVVLSQLLHCRSMLDSATSGMASVMSLTSSRLRASLAMGASPEAAPEAEVQAAEPDFQLTLQSASGSCVLLYPQVSLSAVLCMHPTLCHPLNLETARCRGSSSGVYSMCNNALAARG